MLQNVMEALQNIMECYVTEHYIALRDITERYKGVAEKLRGVAEHYRTLQCCGMLLDVTERYKALRIVTGALQSRFHHSVFYRPDALPAAQPTASKH